MLENSCDSGVTLYGGAIFVSMLSHLSHVSHQVHCGQADPSAEACRHSGRTVKHTLRERRVAGSIPTWGNFFSSCALPVLDFPPCCAVNKTNDQVLIESLMFPLQAREPVNQQCDTITNATRGKKVKGLVKLSANLVLAFLHNEIVSYSSRHKVCQSAQRDPTCRTFAKGYVPYARECIRTGASFVCLLPASSEQL